MCKAFSCLVTKSNKVYWKLGVDTHDHIQDMFVKKDEELIDDKDAPNNTFARIEIYPKNNNYIKPDKWVYEIDERVKPSWIKKVHKVTALEAYEEWKAQLYSKIALDRFPEHPFKIKAPTIGKKHIELVKEWASVRDSVGASVRDSVWASVYGQVGDMFPKIKKWKYTDKVKVKGYPYKSVVKLWRMGLVPVYYQGKWHLYGSPKGNNKIESLWEENA